MLLSISPNVAGAWGPGLQVFFLNNNYPDDGGQLFAYWDDNEGGSVTLNNSTYQPSGGTVFGTTADWQTGQWHHVAFCWDSAKLGLFLDGGIVMIADRPSPASYHDKETGLFMFGHNSSAYGVHSTWNGKVDEVVFWDSARYTGSYTPPGPLQAPGGCQNVLDMGYSLEGDFNRDCRVDSADLAFVAADWLRCNDPNNPNCEQTW